jgi:hypothetical protein
MFEQVLIGIFSGYFAALILAYLLRTSLQPD